MLYYKGLKNIMRIIKMKEKNIKETDFITWQLKKEIS